MDRLCRVVHRCCDTHGPFDHVQGLMMYLSKFIRSYIGLSSFVAGFLFLLLLSPHASAASVGSFPDQGSAYAACKADLDRRLASPDAGRFDWKGCAGFSSSDGMGSYQCSGYYGGSYICGTVMYYQFPLSNKCSARSALGKGVVGGTGAFNGQSTCDNGCLFSGGPGVSIEMNGKTWGLTDGMTPTGATCNSGEVTPKPVAEDDCVAHPTLTQCVKPDGRICTKASTGKMFCYEQSENGSKSSGNEATVITPDGIEAKPPSTPPANGGEWVKVGEGSITTTKGGVTVTQNVTTYVSNYGTSGSNTGAEGDKDKGENEGIKASTGAGCDSPSFQCSDMSSVECNQLIQTFYARCRGKQINGGANCDAPPTCEGNSTDCYIGQQLWNFRCDGKEATEGNGAALSTFDAQVNSEGDGTDEPDAASMPMGNGNTADMGIWEEKKVGGAEDLAKLNSSGFLGGSGSCPQLPTVAVAGVGVKFNLNPICDLLRNVGIMVMALAYWLAYRIIAKVKT